MTVSSAARIRISLVYPAGERSTLGVGADPAKDFLIPLGIASIAGAIRSWSAERNIKTDIQVLDMPTMGLDADLALAQLRNFSPDIVGLSVLTPAVITASAITSALKADSPDTLIVWGGVHPSLVPDRVLYDYPVDIVVRGEGEQPIWEIIQARAAFGKNHSALMAACARIPGLVLRRTDARSGKVFLVHADPPRRANLDSLPSPAYDLFPLQLYSWRGTQTISVESHRGCSKGRCSFCVVPSLYGRRSERKSPLSFARLLTALQNSCGFNDFYVVSDDFVSEPRWVSDFASMIDKNPQPIGLEVYARADTLAQNQDLAAKLRHVGVTTVFLGIESGDENILRSLNKEISLSQAETAVRLLGEQGIVVIAAFVIGSPEESEASVRKSMSFAEHLKSLAPVILHLTTATPYPGTLLRRHFSKHGLCPPEDWNHLDPHAGAHCGSLHLTKDDIRELRRLFVRGFYTAEYSSWLLQQEPYARIARGFIRMIDN